MTSVGRAKTITIHIALRPSSFGLRPMIMPDSPVDASGRLRDKDS